MGGPLLSAEPRDTNREVVVHMSECDLRAGRLDGRSKRAENLINGKETSVRLQILEVHNVSFDLGWATGDCPTDNRHDARNTGIDLQLSQALATDEACGARNQNRARTFVHATMYAGTVRFWDGPSQR